MTNEEICKLLHSTETSRVERTISTGDMDKFQEAICAFSNDMANSRLPGYLIIGAKDNGELSGLKVDDNLMKKIAGIRSDGNILPIPMMTCERYELEGGDLLIVEVQPSFSTPVRYRGRTFIRIGPRRDIATLDEERILSEKRISNMATFDASPCYAASLDDVYVDMVEKLYIPKAVDESSLENDDRSTKQKMTALGLYDMEHEKPTNACMILFGKNPKRFLFGAYLQFVRFAGTDKGADVDSDQAFNECLALMLPKLEAFIDYGILKKRPVAVSTLREQDKYNYPADAIRELALNALMHRDYQSNAPTRLYQFDDRIEIMNPGGLYGKARPENFPDMNDYRNPIIAQALKVMGYVNMFNRGISRVRRMMAEAGNLEPAFDISKITAFEVTCFSALSVNNLRDNNERLEAAISKIFPRYFQDEERRTVMMLLEQMQTEQTAQALAKLLSCTTRTLRDKYLAPMIEAGVVVRTIPDKPKSKNQRYVLAKK